MNSTFYFLFFILTIVIKYPRKRPKRFGYGLIDHELFPYARIPKPPIKMNFEIDCLRFQERFIINHNFVLYHYIKTKPIIYRDYTMWAHETYTCFEILNNQLGFAHTKEVIIKSKVGNRKIIQRLKKLRSGNLMIDLFI